MSNRNTSFAVCVCLAFSAVAFGQGTQGAGYLFQIPGPTSSSGQFFGYVATANPLANSITATGPSGLSLILPKPDGSKFYLLGNAGTTSLQSVDAAFTTFHSINGLDLTPAALSLTSDGKYLLVGTDVLYVVDANTDQVLGQGIQLPGTPTNASGYNGPPCPACWIVSNRDSTRVYVLTNSAFGSQITAINPATRAKLGTMSLPFGGAISMAVSPQGLLYVTAANRIYIVDGDKLALTTGTDGIGVVAELSQLQFLPDGTAAFAINTSPAIGRKSIGKLTIATNSFADWPPNTGQAVPVFDGLVVAGNNRIFAHGTGLLSDGSTAPLGGLWDVSVDPVGAGCTNCSNAESALSAILPAQNVLAMAVSNEVPSARFLFLLVANGNQTNLYRIALSNNTVDTQTLPATNVGLMQYAAVPPQTGASRFLQFNDLQIVNPGSNSAPFIARILTATGQPIFNVSTTFSIDASGTAAGLVINSPTVISNSNGYVATTITVPTGAPGGVYPITLTAGSATVNFSINVTGSVVCVGAGCQSNPSQVTIASGDGQLVQENFHTLTTNPLTVLVTDTKGNPLPNVSVSFVVTAGVGLLTNPSTVTDANGHASTDFFAEAVQGFSYQVNTVTATTPYGSVNFTVTAFHLNLNGTGYPETNILTPTLDSGPSGRTVTAGLGTPVPNAITAQINAGAGTGSAAPLAGVGLYTLDHNDPNQSPANSPAQCQGSTLSDQNGIAHCTLLVSCSTTVGTHQMDVVIGGLNSFSVALNVVVGGASKINVLSGNNQSGTAGQLLPGALLATINDGCGSPVPGVVVTWKVTQGSATLSNTINTSDSIGRVSTKVTLGQTPGPIQVTLSVANLTSQVFTLTNQVVIASVTAVSGTNQTASTGTNFSLPVVFLVRDVNGNNVPGIQVAFTVTSGSATVTPPTATTDSAGHASTTVGAGVPAGPIVITATAGGVSGAAILTSHAPGPNINANSFQNSASFAVGLVPCGLATVIGAGLAPGLQPGQSVSGASLFGPLSYQVNGLSITVNGAQAPIQVVLNSGGKEQATFQTPCEVAPGTATVIVTVNGGSTTVTPVQVFQSQPGIFTYQGVNGKQYGAVIRATDGSYVTPTSQAHRGETYYVVVTGLGQVSPPTATNSAGIAGQTVVVPVTVTINNAPVPVVAGQSLYLQGAIGVYIIGFQIPADATIGTDQSFEVDVTINNQKINGNSVFLPGIQ